MARQSSQHKHQISSSICMAKEISALNKKIDMVKLKEFALTMPDSQLRDLLLSENPTLDALTFIARIPIWLKLAQPLKKK